MRRADRLFRLLQRLRRGRVTTATELAEALDVSERTVYRDVRDLQLSGVPILGEAGVGYALPKGFDLPPLMFTEGEIEALVLGARIVKSWGDRELAQFAEEALSKIEAVLPPKLRARIPDAALFAPDFHVRSEQNRALGPLRNAVRDRKKVQLAYEDKKQAATSRTVRPLGLFYWGGAWSLGAWCELRVDFRNFRIDRIRDFTLLEETFADEPGRTLRDFFRHYDPNAT